MAAELNSGPTWPGDVENSSESRELYLEMLYWLFPSMREVRCGLYIVAK